MLRASPGFSPRGAAARLAVTIAAVAVAAGASAGCGNIRFDVDQDIPATTIFGDPNQMVLAGSTEPQPLTLDIQAETESRHTGPASAAYLKDLTFTIPPPAGGTFSFAHEVHISLTPKTPSSNLPSIEIAPPTPAPAETTIHLQPLPGINMLPY